jgi:hypothetical protein
MIVLVTCGSPFTDFFGRSFAGSTKLTELVTTETTEAETDEATEVKDFGFGA